MKYPEQIISDAGFPVRTIRCPFADCKHPLDTYDDVEEFYGHVVLGHGYGVNDEDFERLLIEQLYHDVYNKPSSLGWSIHKVRTQVKHLLFLVSGLLLGTILGLGLGFGWF